MLQNSGGTSGSLDYSSFRWLHGDEKKQGRRLFVDIPNDRFFFVLSSFWGVLDFKTNKLMNKKKKECQTNELFCPGLRAEPGCLVYLLPRSPYLSSYATVS